MVFGNLISLKLRLHVQDGAVTKQFLPFTRPLRKAERIESLFLEFDEPDIDRVEMGKRLSNNNATGWI
jgi:hypothetical protein